MTDTANSDTTTTTPPNGAQTAASDAVATGEKGARDYSGQVSAIFRPMSCDISTTQGKTKSKQLAIVGEVLTGEYKGQIVRYTGLFNQDNAEQYARTLESLQTTGAKLEIDPKTKRFKDFGTKDPMAVLEWQEVPATSTRKAYMELRAVFLNSSTGVRNTLSDDEFSDFVKDLKAAPSASVKEGEVNADGTMNVTAPDGKRMKF